MQLLERCIYFLCNALREIVFVFRGLSAVGVTTISAYCTEISNAKRMEWYIKIYRQLLDWEWYTDTPTKSLFIHLLLKANIKDGNWRWTPVKKWSLVTGRKKLSEELWLTESQIRTSLEKLQSTNEIAIKTTKSFSVVLLNNWDKYQEIIANKVPNQSPTNRQPIATGREGNKERKKEDTIVSTEIVKSDNRNQDIQKLIYHIKEFCSSRSIIYDSTDERNFAKHIVSAKEFGELSKAMGKERIELALSIIELAEMDKFWRGKVCWPKSIYQNRAKILNNGRATYINQNSNPDVLVI